MTLQLLTRLKHCQVYNTVRMVTDHYCLPTVLAFSNCIIYTFTPTASSSASLRLHAESSDATPHIEAPEADVIPFVSPRFMSTCK